jgi:nucleotide-binding universal stress UspA family protein
MKIEKILAPTDLSELSVAGLRYALEAAQAEGAELIVYHVIGPSEEWLARHEEILTMQQVVDNRRRVLSQFVKVAFGTLPPDVRLRTEVDLGVPHRKIVEKANDEKVDLIILSTHGWSGLLRMLIGSVTEKVVSRASCPVLSIHPLESSAPAAPAAS